jgi:plasmid maintenance system antidote protein VapI
MVTNTEVYPDIAVPPGEFLLEEIAARGISQKELARRMSRHLIAINEIVKSKKASRLRRQFSWKKHYRRSWPDSG